MRQILARLAAASAMFALGILAAAVSPDLYRRDAPAAPQASAGARPEEEQVIAAVFRFQMENRSGRDLLPAYYLSCHNYADPPPRVLDYLRGVGLPAQALSQLPASGASARYADGRWYNAPVFLRVGRPAWVGDGEVIVGGAVRGSYVEASAYVYRVVREGGRWKVVAAETVS